MYVLLKDMCPFTESFLVRFVDSGIMSGIGNYGDTMAKLQREQLWCPAVLHARLGTGRQRAHDASGFRRGRSQVDSQQSCG